MAKYDPWDAFFLDVDGTELRCSLDDFEALTGVTLPESARTHASWWSSAHYYAKWSDHGWYAHPKLADGEIVFSREPSKRGRPRGSKSIRKVEPTAPLRQSTADLILLGCVSQKGTEPAPARDLYISPLWRKRRAYAERTGTRWMILSAEHGLLDPDEVVAPYDRYLESQPRAYRDDWSRSAVEDVTATARGMGARTIELHAGSAYLDYGLVSGLEHAGFSVIRPLQGMRIGQQLAWYGGGAPSAERPHQIVTEPMRTISGDHVHRIANDYASGVLGESWGELPETGAFRLPDASPTAARLWLTFICAVDRARDAERLWSAGLRAWGEEAWLFDPAEVASRPFWQLADLLRSYRLSQRHAQDASAWRMIGESLVADDCPEAIRTVIDGERTQARDLINALDATHPGGTKRFPLLSGPKIGPMWVRMMTFPGGTEIRGMEVIPVAVDTHVQRVTEMLGLVAPRELDDRHRTDIQAVWFEGVRVSGNFGGPDPIDGTAAALDPALWVLGKNGCSNCERAGRKLAVGTICEFCPLGRIVQPETSRTKATVDFDESSSKVAESGQNEGGVAMSKYSPLGRYLRSQKGPRHTMDFEEVALLVGGLPNSAFSYDAWWGNSDSGNHVQAAAWLDAGWRVVGADRRTRRVTFVLDESGT